MPWFRSGSARLSREAQFVWGKPKPEQEPPAYIVLKGQVNAIEEVGYSIEMERIADAVAAIRYGRIL